jgi:predicted nucleic acid-binding Zn ribbon protein
MARVNTEMVSLQKTMPAVVAELLKRGPMSEGKIEMAWNLTVGVALTRVTRARLIRDGLLQVTAADERWVRELRRSVPTIVPRLNALLGSEVVTRIEVTSASSNSPSRVTKSAAIPNPQSRTPNPGPRTPNPQSPPQPPIPDPEPRIPNPDK